MERYSGEYELYCDIERAVLMTKVRGMESSVQLHSIVMERYSSEEAQYFGREGPVLMHGIVILTY